MERGHKREANESNFICMSANELLRKDSLEGRKPATVRLGSNELKPSTSAQIAARSVTESEHVKTTRMTSVTRLQEGCTASGE
jgi:hypothetical protein